MKYEFNQFWIEYDYKVGRKKCQNLWAKISDQDKQRIANHVPAYVRNTKKDGTYPSRKHPSTYLNQESWNDEIITVKTKPTRGLSEATKGRIDDFLAWESGGADTEQMDQFVSGKKVQRFDSEEYFESTSRLHRQSEAKGYYSDPERGTF